MSGDVPRFYSVTDTPNHQKIQLSKRFVGTDTSRHGGLFVRQRIFLAYGGHIRAYLHRMQPG